MDFSILIIKNKKIKKLVNINLLIALFTCLFGIAMMWVYNIYFISLHLLDISIIIYRTGLLIGIFSYMCGIVFENYLDIR